MNNKLVVGLGSFGTGFLLLSSPAVFADISGKVFHDFNGNGSFDTASPQVEAGVAGVIVTATDAAGNTVSTTTAADGTYAFPNSGPTATGNKVRIEFSNLPDFANSGGSVSGTTTQFVTANASDVNFAVTYADNFCEANPKVATPMYIASAAPSLDNLMMFSYQNEGTAAQDKTGIATTTQVGSLWGVAYSRSKKLLYSSAVLKRHVPLGAEGLDAIYTVDPFSGTPNATPWLQLTDDLGVAVSSVAANPQYLDNAARGLDAYPQNDASTFTDVLKVGIGDIELSADEKTLYAVNAYDKKVYAIDVASKTISGSYTIPNPSCSSGEARPWALGQREGKIYVGVTCDGSASGNPANLADNSGVNNLKANVYRLDGASFTSVLDVPLNYDREPPFEYTDNCKDIRKWKPWTDILPATCADGNISYPSPLLTDIEFTDNGDMILGFTDRTGFQIGHQNYGLTGTTLYSLYVAGDILRACKTDTGWGIEGSVPGCASAGGLAINQIDPNGYTTNSAGQLAKAGEFYEGDYFHGDGNIDGTGVSWFPGHPEISIGGLAVLPNSNQVMSTAYDPVTGATNYGTGGVITLDNLTGKRPRNGYQLYKNEIGAEFTAAKGVGLGDLELLCDQPPLEVGNRVWRDTDADGIQDADEPGIDGVEVVLTCGTDTATATTANGGQYVFSSMGNATFLTSGKNCTLAIASGQTPLDGLSVTQQNAEGATDNNPVTDVRDSDANAAGEIAFTMGTIGENNHSLDIGYKSTPAVTLDFGDAPDSYKTLATTNGAQHTIVAGLNLGAVVDAETDGQPNAAADGDGADEDGVNFMTPLAPGKRAIIGVATTQPRTSDAKLDAWIDFNGDGDFEDVGEQIATNLNIKGITLYDQGSTVLDIEVPATAKTGVTYARFRLSSAGGLSPSGAAPDGEVEDYAITIVSGATLGNFVWQDTNKDGIQDAGEPPVAGVQVNLIRVSDGAVVDSLFTDSNGEYLFTHVAPDTYQVAFVAPTGYSFTTAMQGSDDTKDSNADASGLTPSITLADGDDQRQWDAGLVLAENTLVHCAAVPRQPTEVNTTFTLPKFDSALGTLQTVNVSAYASTQQFVALENYAAQTQKIKITTSVDGVLILPDANIVDTTYAYNSGFKDLTVADGILDYQGTSALAFADWQYAVDSSNVIYATPADFTTANAGETIALPYETMSGYSVTGGGGNNQSFQRTFANAGACVAYVYEKKAPAVDISLTKVANKTEVKRGETVVYTLTVTNDGTDTATGVIVTDKLPDGVGFVSHNGAAAEVYNAGTGEWDVGELLPGAANAKTLSITVTVN
ncbi:SdrD B-like domain-containing protein [Thiothrix subterranea]|uniref:SdrD B-like domain-containing protein n=1 Tax=Thiothrix subterranea TaxID=2735563 RepID=A0AA51MLZ9_9GAMM|nr:SdrD B-like domain-containing protein [Thiothrix subterranea]WML86428.1 SdrD B-like domain-containing protein [Thiothrix subterranea]